MPSDSTPHPVPAPLEAPAPAPPPESAAGVARPPSAAGGRLEQAGPRRSAVIGAWRNMLYSTLAILGVVLAARAFAPPVKAMPVRTVDVAAAAVETARKTGLPVERFADGVPWRGTSVRFADGPAGLPTWQAGHHRGDHEYVGILQTAASSDPERIEEWLGSYGARGQDATTLRVGGRSWQRFGLGADAGRDVVMSTRPEGRGGLVTVLIGKGVDVATVEELAGRLVAAPTAAPSASPSRVVRSGEGAGPGGR